VPRLLTALALLLGTSTLLALPEDSDQPIHIRADVAEMDRAAERIVYRGSVRVDQGTLRVDADQLTVEYEDERVVRIVAEGSPASYRQALDNPPGEVVAQATTIIYFTRDEQLELNGNAFLTQQGNEISGDSIRYDMVAGRVEALSGEGGAVRMVLQPAPREP